MRHFHPLCRASAMLIALAMTSAPALAEVKVQDAWVRGMVPGQDTTGAYMKLQSTSNAVVVAARSPAAKSVELHSMSMEGGVMKMRGMPRLELKPGQPVELSPSGMHLMMLGVAHPLHAGERVPITLSIEDAKGQRSEVEVSATVRPINASEHGGHQH
ncbi:MAG TPA: copper chaperone PCu(A)C [Casimicrobiaceae bacterium]|nr:copper chaperone PCu(A)C [Casimicrobiaceae bacterium]